MPGNAGRGTARCRMIHGLGLLVAALAQPYGNPEWSAITSVDGGWRLWYGVASSYDGVRLASIAYNGNIFVSADSGATWNEVTATGAEKKWQSIASSSDGTTIVASARDDHIWISSDAGTTWTQVTSTGGAKYWKSVAVSADGTQMAGALYPGTIWLSYDSGVTWTEDASGLRPQQRLEPPAI